MTISINRRYALIGATSLALASGATPVWAHRLTTTETRVDINSMNRNIEVIHTFHVHDTATALLKAGVIDGPDLISLRSRAQLALYVDKKFSLLNKDKAVDLTIIGAELDKRNILVFQEGKLDAPMGDITVMASMMRGLVHNQINNVDIAVDGKITSLQFRGNDKSKKVLA